MTGGCRMVASVAPTNTMNADEMPNTQIMTVASVRRPPRGPNAAVARPAYEPVRPAISGLVSSAISRERCIREMQYTQSTADATM